MTTISEPDPTQLNEIWEITTESTVWVWVIDKRNGGYMKSRVGGPNGGSKRLRVTVDERRYNEEIVAGTSGDQSLNPFQNGLLRLVSTAEGVDDIDTSAHLTDEDLQGLLDLRDPIIFEAEVEQMRFELPLRRLKALADTQGTNAQIEFLRELLAQRYPVGGTQSVVQEMLDEEERQTGSRLS